MKRRDAIILVLILVILFLLWKRTASYFTQADVAKARELKGKNMADIDVVSELVKGGTHPDEALKAVKEAKGAALDMPKPK